MELYAIKLWLLDSYSMTAKYILSEHANIYSYYIVHRSWYKYSPII